MEGEELMRQVVIIIAIVCLSLTSILTPVARARGASAADFLVEIAEDYYEKQDYAQALHELKKALLIEPVQRVP